MIFEYLVALQNPKMTKPIIPMAEEQRFPIPITLAEQPGFNCFGCASHNPAGLKLTFFANRKQEVGCVYKASSDHVSFAGIVHGGILATVIDDLSYYCLLYHVGRPGLTTNVNVNYRKPAFAKNELTGLSVLASQDERQAVIGVRLLDSSGAVCAEGTTTYALVNKTVFERIVGKGEVDGVFTAAEQLHKVTAPFRAAM
eukprot:TRINITY_DN4723_c0_g1_i1.p1 TRINITY_DN4723_c0_g1~~TRINITY_DN4723_c0_g1_i1.p1  ORF type:complete len:199 (+),score=22.85 TRINITY_DN4723_c0_g1_i1:152-748(+)